MRRILLLALLTLAACSAPQGIHTTGSLRIQSVQPDVVAGCPVRAGDWMALKGNAFGTQADWDTGVNHALFPPEPGLPAENPEITQGENPATLMFRVPQGGPKRHPAPARGGRGGCGDPGHRPAGSPPDGGARVRGTGTSANPEVTL